MARNTLLLEEMLAETAIEEARMAMTKGQPSAASFGGKRRTYMQNV